jgi:Ca-activated chloride channel family protein
MHRTTARNAWPLAALICMMIGGCSEDEVQRYRANAESNARLTWVQDSAQELAGKMAGEEDGEEDGAGATAMALDEGRMGPSRREAGQYAVRSSRGDAASARQRAVETARNAGVLGVKDSADPSSGLDDGEVYGGLIENEGVFGVGPGGGGWGTIGAGRYGTIGHGSGTGAGYGAGYGVYNSLAQNTESYKDYGVNRMTAVAEDKVSTFSIDVDTASYSMARRKILDGALPPPASVRVEEFINYFKYEYADPQGDKPLAVHMDAAPSPFTKALGKNRYLMRVGVQAKKPSIRERKAMNLVFLVDVSGSMDSPDKLGLAKQSLRILTSNLRDGDSVALVTYAGSVRVVLEPTRLERKRDILAAIDSLYAGGSTSMGSGIELAYQMAARKLGPDMESRVIVLSDGDANVGRTSHEDILKTISGNVKEGVTLSTIGFGMGNYKDVMMEQLANKGNGNYYYIDDIVQARRVFQEQLGSMLEVVAQDVKIQVEFDPEVVTHYRLIGYENRDIADRDFRNDRVDAGEVGAGHSVTALYEIALAGKVEAPLAVVRVRAKKPRGEKAREWVEGFDLDHLHASFADAPRDLRFATAVMGAAEILRGNEYASSWSLKKVIELGRGAAGDDRDRVEFVRLMGEVQPRLARVARVTGR